MAQLSKKPVPERWVCAYCSTTNTNDIGCLKCRKPKRALIIQSATPIVSEKWSCSVCTFENSAERSTCEICGTRKPKQPIILPTLKYEEQTPTKLTPSVASASLASKKQTPERSLVASASLASLAPKKQTPEKSVVASATSAPPKKTPEKSVVTSALAPKQSVADEWECGHCTFINRKKNDKCEICNEKNPMFIQEEKQCSICTSFNPKYREKCWACGGTKFGEIPVEPTWICFICKHPNINNPLPRCSKCTNSRAEKIGNIGFFKQDTAMGCMRQAINNIEQKFAVVNSGIGFEEKNLQEEISPLNIKAFCDIISQKIDSQTEQKGEIVCDNYENYEYNFLNKILSYLRYVLVAMYGTDTDQIDTKIKNFDENAFDENSVLFINLGEVTDIGARGRHWVSARYIEGKWYYFDGKAQAPKIFNTKNELVNYLKTSPDFTINHKPVNISIYIKLDHFIPNNPFITMPERLPDYLLTGGGRYNHNKQLYKLLKNMI